MRWAVIERAGYVGEYVAKRDLPSYGAACDWMNERYRKHEQEGQHIDIAHWDEEGEFWSYDH